MQNTEIIYRGLRAAASRKPVYASYQSAECFAPLRRLFDEGILQSEFGSISSRTIKRIIEFICMFCRPKILVCLADAAHRCGMRNHLDRR